MSFLKGFFGCLGKKSTLGFMANPEYKDLHPTRAGCMSETESFTSFPALFTLRAQIFADSYNFSY